MSTSFESRVWWTWVAVAAMLVGCGDPLAGDWKSEDPTCGSHEIEMTIDSSSGDVSGTFEAWFEANDGSCVKCEGSISGSESGDGRWDVEGDFSGDHGCDDLSDIECECRVRGDAEDELSCDCDAPYGDIDFEKVD